MKKQRIRVQNVNSVLAVSKSLLTTEYYGFEHGYGKSKDYKIGVGVKGQILNVMGRDYVSELSNTSICVLLYRKVITLKIQLNIYLSPVQSRIYDYQINVRGNQLNIICSTSWYICNNSLLSLNSHLSLIWSYLQGHKFIVNISNIV